jgi:hypothetical protein
VLTQLRGLSFGRPPRGRQSSCSGDALREGSCTGTWGTGIFDDDTGCDVRSHYRRALRAGVPGPQATDQILREHAPGLDPFDTRSGWALPPPRPSWAKAKALEIIDSGADLAAWAEVDAATRRRRQATLQRLRRRLLGPQPPRCSSSPHGARTPP